MKFDDVQVFRLRQSYDNAAYVLNELKRKTLKGKDLQQMKRLEEVVQLIQSSLMEGS